MGFLIAVKGVRAEGCSQGQVCAVGNQMVGAVELELEGLLRGSLWQVGKWQDNFQATGGIWCRSGKAQLYWREEEDVPRYGKCDLGCPLDV